LGQVCSVISMEKKRKIIPPVYLLITLVLIWFSQRYLPVFQYIDPPVAYAGIIPVLFGITMAAMSAGMFKKADTGLEPFDEATVLVTGGFYRLTRNPMYMGMFLMLLGVAFLMGNIGALLPVPLFVLVIRNNFVLGEERFLEAAFGQHYLDYKSEVRRWI
jgi:protein-S-isoprenylcysteine O-methyltransferase Ste14